MLMNPQAILNMKLDFNEKRKDDAEAIGSRTIKKEDRSSLKLPELGRLEDWATDALPDKFTLLSLRDKEGQIADA